MSNLLKSRKLLVALVTGLITAFGPKLGLQPGTIADICNVATFYIVGQSVADAVAVYGNTTLTKQGS